MRAKDFIDEDRLENLMSSPDDMLLFEMANLPQETTGMSGIIYIS